VVRVGRGVNCNRPGSRSFGDAKWQTSSRDDCPSRDGDVYDANIFLIGGQLRLADWANAGWTSPSRDAVSWALSAETWSGINAQSAFAVYEQHAGSI
jgi:hypothetical protein